LKKNNIRNDVVIARDGVEALDYLFGTGAYAGRDTQEVPELILLDLKLQRTVAECSAVLYTFAASVAKLLSNFILKIWLFNKMS
jgi:hypothetical protein